MADSGQFAYRDPEVANAYGPPSTGLDNAVAGADANIMTSGALKAMDERAAQRPTDSKGRRMTSPAVQGP